MDRIGLAEMLYVGRLINPLCEAINLFDWTGMYRILNSYSLAELLLMSKTLDENSFEWNFIITELESRLCE